MRFCIASGVLLLWLNLPIPALGISWDFEAASSTAPPGWTGGGWRTNQGKLTNIEPGSPDTNLGAVQTPSFRVLPSSATAAAGDDFGAGIGSGDPTLELVISISNFSCNPIGDVANCVIELIRVDQNSNRIKTLSSGPYSGPIVKTYTYPDVVTSGIYSVRFRADDQDDPNTWATAADLSITNVAFDSGFPTGDYNRNGAVDAADYVLWRNSLGNIGEMCAGADGNCNTFIDNGDYPVWKQHFGETKQGSTAEFTGGVVAANALVPEPGGWTNLCVIVVTTVSFAHRGIVITFRRPRW
jgi:hypothetical protein